ncbi:TonB-dependent receptor [Prevotella dentasini JCM 15908]
MLLLFLSILNASAQKIAGRVIDKTTQEPIIGAIVEVTGTSQKAVTDIDGNFTVGGLQAQRYSLVVNFIGYRTRKIDGVQADEASEGNLLVDMAVDERQLEGVTVTAVKRTNTESAAIQSVKSSPVIISNVSAQEIQKTQDSDAGEVIRRVPGVSVIEDKFVMVRGLSQRYNNVWINGGAVPSSEADSRAFSFDIIPSSQIDNLTIVKTPTAPYPADYTGGFIMIDTKEIPLQGYVSVSAGGNWNDMSHFRSFLQNQRNDSWMTPKTTPVGDLKLSASTGQQYMVGEEKLGLVASVNYTREYRRLADMQNNLYGIYDTANDRKNYLRHSVDDQYNDNSRLGAMLNLTLLSKSGSNKYQLKNIFNRLGTTRYTWREGVTAQANMEHSAEYYYRSRTTYNGQITGKHTLTEGNVLDWSIGYAYANRRLPDRRRYLVDDALEAGVYALSTGNDISREWTKLDEHIFSANANYSRDFSFSSWQPSLKVGVYGEYRTREYATEEKVYNWNTDNNNMPDGFRYIDIPTLLSDGNNYGPDKLHLLELSQWRNNYRGHNTLGAGYLSVSLPFGKLGILAGIRFEHNDMELISNTRDTERSESSRHYATDDFFPSLSGTFKFNDRHQLRAGYGRSINRPEFREVSPAVYYDFDLASDVQGNTELSNCYIDNLDLRWEYYPSKGEYISLAAFYKHFANPIEWTYTVAGGTDLIYSYKNADNADNYGLELDIRKSLDIIGLPDFSWSFNGALIRSRVEFAAGSKEENRPMQGQSPYLANTGFFYHNEKEQLQVGLLYNRIGKRIIGVGRSEGSVSDNETARIPDSYEMPRNTIDLSVSKRFGKHWEARLNVRDLLAETVYYKQFADVSYSNGTHKEVEEITRSFKPGRNIGFSIEYKF